MGSERTNSPAIDTTGMSIRQIGIVVRDAARTARRYSEIFGVGPWVFLDIHPTDVILHDKPLAEECCIRLALANLGKIQLELLQPVYGPSTHMEFLEKHGEGVHHVSLGLAEAHDEIVSAARKAGVGIEMQGVLGGAVTFTYLATQQQLGTILEIAKPGSDGAETRLPHWGTYAPERPGRIDLGGKEIVQVGIVVEDAEEKAKQYWKTLGIGPWVLLDFKPPHVSDGRFHGIRMRNDGDIHIRAALADLGDVQFELLQPALGPSTHMDFLKMHGEGVHHLSFGALDDHDQVLSAFEECGIKVEMTGTLGGAAIFTYLETQRDLGTIFEMVKVIPGAQSTLVPYGSYPPAQRL
jgi:hypothetical protein